MSDHPDTTNAPTQDPCVSIAKFSTLEVPEKERFDAWIAGNLCDCRLQDDDTVPFNSEASGAALGPLILSCRKWLDRSRTAPYEIKRTAQRIRVDGQDFFRLTVFLDGKFVVETTNQHGIKRTGDLVMFDFAQPQECIVGPGEALALAIPRDLLPRHAELLHGHTLSSGIGRLLGDHLQSLYLNLSSLRERDVPFVVQSTLQLLTAAVAPTAETVQLANTPILEALRQRVLRHIDAHLFDADLSPDQICRNMGLSRAKLYQLFEGSGGVMRQIQRRRLFQAYRLLADPSRPPMHIAEIAWAHGFPNEKHFYRAFKAEFGHTPKETLGAANSGNSLSAETSRRRGGAEIGGSFKWTLPFGVYATDT